MNTTQFKKRAEKVSFGPVWGAGANRRSVLMGVLSSLKRQKGNVEYYLKQALDHFAKDPHQDLFSGSRDRQL